jgi:hypothetical protein
MNQIKAPFLCCPEGAQELRQCEKGKLREGQAAFFHVLEYSCAVAEPLEFQWVKIREARDPDSRPILMSRTPGIMGSEDMQMGP